MAIKVVSFDMEGTLVSLDFSHKVWHEGIPALYAQAQRLDIEEAGRRVREQYDEVGEHRPEWYDISYWFQRFGLSDPQSLLEAYLPQMSIYPDAPGTLKRLGQTYPLVIASGSSREFLKLMTGALGHPFERVFSAISDCGHPKTEAFYHMLCHEMDVLPEEVAHVGDHEHFDYLVPRSLGVQAFHLDRSGKRNGHLRVTDLRQFENICVNGSFDTGKDETL